MTVSFISWQKTLCILQKFSGDGLELADLEEIIWTEDFKKCMDQKDVFHFYLQNEQKTLLCYNLFRDGQFFCPHSGKY